MEHPHQRTIRRRIHKRHTLCTFTVIIILLLLILKIYSHASSVMTPTLSPLILNSIRQYLQRIEPLDPAAATLDSSINPATDWVHFTTYYGSDAFLVDDYPYFLLPSPFLFLFNGRVYDTVYVSPNGGLHFASDVLCCDSNLQTTGRQKCFETTTCNFNTSYSNMIAPFLTDLNPSLSADATLAYHATEERVKIRWNKFPFANPPSVASESQEHTTVTFQVDLYSNGMIRIHLIDILDPNSIVDESSPTQSHDWLAGAIRYDVLETTPNFATLAQPSTHEQYVYVRQQESWATSRPGAYPYKSEIASNQTITYCPISVHWCMAPSVGSTDGGTHIHLLASDLTCFTPSHNPHQAQCRFYPCTRMNVTNPTSNTTTQTVEDETCSPVTPFIAAPAHYDNTTGTMVCSTPPVSAFSTKVSADYESNLVQLQLFDLTSHLTIATVNTLKFRYVTPNEANELNSQLPTLTSPGPYGEDLRLLQLGVYPFMCTECASVLTSICTRDCAGVYGGIAVIDDCGVCTGGSANQSSFNGDMDCSGQCFTKINVTSSSYTSPSFQPSLIDTGLSYCACNNVNATAAEQSLTNYGQPLPDNIAHMLEEFGCQLEETQDVATTLTPLRYYRYALLGIVSAGVFFIPTAIIWKNRCFFGNEPSDGDDDDDNYNVNAQPVEHDPNSILSPNPVLASPSPSPSSYHPYDLRPHPPLRHPSPHGGVSFHPSPSASSSSSIASRRLAAHRSPRTPSTSSRRTVHQQPSNANHLLGHASSSSSSSSSSVTHPSNGPAAYVAVPMQGIGASLALASNENIPSNSRRPSNAERISELRQMHQRPIHAQPQMSNMNPYDMEYERTVNTF